MGASARHLGFRRHFLALATLLGLAGMHAVAWVVQAEQAGGDSATEEAVPMNVAAHDAELAQHMQAAMEGIKTQRSVAQRAAKEQLLAEWEVSLHDQLDEYLRSVADSGTAPPQDSNNLAVEGAASNSGIVVSEAPQLAEVDANTRHGVEQGQVEATPSVAEETAVAEVSETQGEPGVVLDAGKDSPDVDPAVANEQISATTKLELLQEQLFMNEAKRNIPHALEGLSALALELEQAVPATPNQRRMLKRETSLPSGPPYKPQPPPLPQALRKHIATAALAASRSIAKGGRPDEFLLELIAPGDAAFLLAGLAATGIASPHVPFNDTWAVRALHQSVLTGSVSAHAALADRYLHGRGVPKDCWWGLEHLKIFAESAVQTAEETGDFQPPLPTVRFRDRWLDPNYVDAHEMENGEAQVEMEEDMARRGSAEAQRHLGFRRLLGQGMEANPEHALREFQAAAAEGDPYAMFNMGYMYLRGLGAQRNFQQAQHWFEQAAEAGLPAAYNGLGVMNFNGQGTSQNFTAARIAFEKGAHGGDADSMFNLGTIFRHGYGHPMNLTLARRHLEEAYAAGHWKAPHVLALMAEQGLGEPANCTRAVQLLHHFILQRSHWTSSLNEAQRDFDSGDEWSAAVRLAMLAEEGCEQAEANLAFILQRGSLFASSHDRFHLAMRLLLRSGRRGGSDSRVEAAHLALEGERFSLPAGNNASRALELYRLAAEGGHEPEAMFNLGWMHAHGIGAPMNSSAAAMWYKKAMKHSLHDDPALAPALALLLLRLEGALQVVINCGVLCDALEWLVFGPPTDAMEWGDEWDNILLAVLCVALATVLWLRWQRSNSQVEARQRERQQQAQAWRQGEQARRFNPPQRTLPVHPPTQQSEHNAARIRQALEERERSYRQDRKSVV